MGFRHQYLDVAKGLGILVVVLGHNQAVQQHPEAFSAIFSFHMPLFFFFSGVTFRLSSPLAELAQKRWKTLLRPYFFTSLVLLAAFFVTKWHMDIAVLGAQLLGMFWGTGRVIVWQWLWFLPHLFLVNLCFAAFIRLLPQGAPAIWLRAAAFTLLLVGGVLLARALWLTPLPQAWPWDQLFGLPFGADLLGITGFFFWLGYEFGRDPSAWLARLRLALLPLLAIFVAAHVFFDYTIDLNYRRYDHIAMCTLLAVAGIGITIALSELAVRHAAPPVVAVFEYLGRASLVIFIFHVFLQAKSLFVAIEILHLPYWPAHALSFAGGVIAPVILYEIIRRIKPLKSIYIPA